MLSTLPVEILLEIIQYLPLTTIGSLPTLSKSWATFMSTNEPSIYFNVSREYGYAGSDAAAPSEGWKAWFIHKLQVELRWIGKLPGNPSRVELPGGPRSFYKIKVDEEAGYVINTFTHGGLIVSDICDHRILWALEEEFCRPMAHCEYDEGYIVVDRPGNVTEVWRRKDDVLDIAEGARPSGRNNKPDGCMLRAGLAAQAKYLDANRAWDPQHFRGQFTPWARLLIPEDPDDELSLKLKRGTLLAFSVGRAFLYDIAKAELEQTIEVSAFGKVLDVDLSEQHVFILCHLNLAVYDRASGLHVLSIHRQVSCASPENRWRCTVEAFNSGELGFQQGAPPNWADVDDYFVAAHVSSCGKHLAIMAMSNRVALVQDFWRLITPPQITLREVLKQIDFCIQRPSLPTNTKACLAYDQGKVAIFGPYGIYVLVLDSVLDRFGVIDLPLKHDSLQNLPRSSEHEPSWPNLRVRKVAFPDLKALDSDVISCLQLTETKLYTSVISEDRRYQRIENMWCYDFGSPLVDPVISQGIPLEWTDDHPKRFLRRLHIPPYHL